MELSRAEATVHAVVVVVLRHKDKISRVLGCTSENNELVLGVLGQTTVGKACKPRTCALIGYKHI